jgi:hypothetical protein
VFTDNNINSNGTTASVSIGGNAATVHTFSSGGINNPYVGIASLVVTTGTTANIVVTYSAGSAGGGGFGVYTLTGLSSTTPVATAQHYLDTAVTPDSLSLATSSGGVIIVGTNDYANFSTVAFSGNEGTYTTDLNNGSGGFDTFGFGHSIGTGTNASSTVTSTWAAVNSHSAMVVASWR